MYKESQNAPREANSHAHPFFVIDVDRSRVNHGLLVETLESLRDTYCAKCIGIGTPDGIERLHVWFYNPDYSYTAEAYYPADLVCFLNKLGFDIGEQDVSMVYGRGGAAHHICDVQHQPINAKEGN